MKRGTDNSWCRDTRSRATFTYNRQGQTISMKDQAGTTHGYVFDKFGRLIEDAVSAFGTGVDQTVKKITRRYEPRGMLEKVSPFNTGGTPLNEKLWTRLIVGAEASEAVSLHLQPPGPGDHHEGPGRDEAWLRFRPVRAHPRRRGEHHQHGY